MTDLSLPDILPYELEPVGAAQQNYCLWTPADDGFDSACGQPWEWHDSGRAGKHPWNYCACCGKRVQIVGERR